MSYARELVTAWSGGGVQLAEAAAELTPFDDLGEAASTVELAPFALRRASRMEGSPREG